MILVIILPHLNKELCFFYKYKDKGGIYLIQFTDAKELKISHKTINKYLDTNKFSILQGEEWLIRSTPRL